MRLGWSGDAEAKLYSSYADESLRRFLEIDPSYIPDASTHLRPSGGKAVSEVRPELAGDMRAYTKPTDWLDFEIEVSTNAGVTGHRSATQEPMSSPTPT